MQNFYGRAIRDNKDNPNAMSISTWAILEHYSEGTTRHTCPKGETSWCSFQRDLSNGSNTYVPTKNPFSNAMIKVMTPLFKHLSDVSFLESCKRCHTQNANESFNNLMWSLSPKNQYVSPVETSLALNLSVCIFNDGIFLTLHKLFQKLGFDTDYSNMESWKNMDHERIYNGDYKIRNIQRIRRKTKKKLMYKKQDAFRHQEETQYSSGFFYKK